MKQKAVGIALLTQTQKQWKNTFLKFLKWWTTNKWLFPRFRNLRKQETNFLRGYAAGFSAGRYNYADQDGIGMPLKENLLNPANLTNCRIGSYMMGETIPKETNHIALSKEEKDQRGMLLRKIHVDYDDNDGK
ncbi:MAG: hypothetical protein JNM78_16710 [Cyclobacteriaceae bacterium]|nr:hypothetical protein [Cyclobacteriaceae bacterium]